MKGDSEGFLVASLVGIPLCDWFRYIGRRLRRGRCKKSDWVNRRWGRGCPYPNSKPISVINFTRKMGVEGDG